MKTKEKREKQEKELIVLPVVDTAGKEVEKIELDSKVFDGRVSSGSIYRAVHNYLANKRGGNASTKDRAEVAGSGKKPWRQKGTGRARVGSVRTPLWRHGGTVFGPQPRDFSYSLPTKIKKLALKSILNNRALNNDIIILNTLVLEDNKTKTFANILKKLKLKEKTLLVANSISDNLMLSTRNIPNIFLTDSRCVNAYDVLRSKKMLITKDALHKVIERLK
ncbi:MAG: 50S ribosomal protein L4 [Candidatus Omnitrophica bacterium]|nr:50S ribosomal protein L4 [Candidatus Omnitrophota bacterium]MDD5352202.1 50S ribosomal protein L4 [Candidatus Omnitrophota bacterium]MDD5549800.1 50S ribosomal protein L4 [Candidatus Omnitrophota bacterium]